MQKTIGHIPNKLPGRHRCECQARIHKLIRNCLSCGRIVCEQEGSGPCVFCEKMVCTREEENVIKNDLKRGMQLERDLMKKAGYGSDLARTKQHEEAQKYRDELLRADRESVIRNRVLDLDADYYNIENGHYLTAEERKAIQKRKEDLHHMRKNRAGRSMMMDLDFASGTVREVETESQFERADDHVIQDILRRAEQRREAEKFTKAFTNRDPDLPSVQNFTPIYDPTKARKLPALPKVEYTNANFLDRDLAYADCERKGFCLALDQPEASAVATGAVWYLKSEQELRVQGPIYIAARNPTVTESGNAVLGKVTLKNCVTGAEFRTENPDLNLDDTWEDDFVLIFDQPDPFPVPIPYMPTQTFHQIPKAFRDILSQSA